ncbi:hypothetical protein ACV3R5_17215 [Clostridium perfringens]|nr:hypothetical protein [Clostridium perfringens]MDU6697840.1 hypothetical protein [Clostridium perfringens]HAT4114542.1 hypothetical protein [Clostridium perfringens]
MLKKIIGGVVLATSLFSITAFAASGYTGDIKTSSGSSHHALAWTKANDGKSEAMAYVAIYDRNGAKLASSNKNYSYGYTQTETITSARHWGNYAQSRHGASWSTAFVLTENF